MTKRYIIQMILTEVKHEGTDAEVWVVQEEGTISQNYTNYQDAFGVYQRFVHAFQAMNGVGAERSITSRLLDKNLS